MRLQAALWSVAERASELGVLLVQHSKLESAQRRPTLALIWHINAFGLVLTSHVVKSVQINTHTHSPDLCPRATLVGMPLPHQLVSLYHDLSHTCIGMFESILLHPYCMNDLWTSVHHPNMEHRMCHHWLTTLEFCLSYFLIP